MISKKTLGLKKSDYKSDYFIGINFRVDEL